MAKANTVDTSQFVAVCHQLSMLSAQPFEKVVTAEIAKALEKCVKLTPRGNKNRIERQTTFRNRSLWDNGDPRDPKKRGHQIGYVTKTGTQWYADMPGPKSVSKGKRMGKRVFYDMNGFFHWSNERWARWQARLGEMRAKQLNVRMILQSIGVARHTWYQIGQQLGVAHLMNVPVGVVHAVPSNGKVYQNGTATRITSAEKLFITITNDSPTVVNRMNGAGILATAISGRIQYFQRNAQKAVFAEVSRIAKAYPALRIKV
jgi:hypothetical protein